MMEILADVYLQMTGGQTALALDGRPSADRGATPLISCAPCRGREPLAVPRASPAELENHREACAQSTGPAGANACGSLPLR
jgi:DNA polymerase-3 subunit epsilon